MGCTCDLCGRGGFQPERGLTVHREGDSTGLAKWVCNPCARAVITAAIEKVLG